MLVIEFTGDNRVGKTTLAKELTSQLLHRGKDVVCLSFGGGIRSELVELYGIPSDIIYDGSINKDTRMLRLGDYEYSEEISHLWYEYGFIPSPTDFGDTIISLRELMITHATHLRRKQDPDYWAKDLVSQYKKFPNLEVLIIDDLRQPNELAGFDQPVIFNVSNDYDNGTDITQEVCRKMIRDNQDRMIPIKTTVPLLKYDATKICKMIIKEHLGIINFVGSKKCVQYRHCRST